MKVSSKGLIGIGAVLALASFVDTASAAVAFDKDLDFVHRVEELPVQQFISKFTILMESEGFCGTPSCLL